MAAAFVSRTPDPGAKVNRSFLVGRRVVSRWIC